jgi:hypothetical protein
MIYRNTFHIFKYFMISHVTEVLSYISGSRNILVPPLKYKNSFGTKFFYINYQMSHLKRHSWYFYKWKYTYIVFNSITLLLDFPHILPQKIMLSLLVLTVQTDTV